jgi:hypothetical protein
LGLRATSAAIDTEVAGRIGSRYRTLQKGMPPGTPIIVFHFDTDRTAFAAGSEAEPAAKFVFAIGSQENVFGKFRDDPPLPGEMRNSIMAVQDKLACAIKIPASARSCSRETGRRAGPHLPRASPVIRR